MCVSTNTGLQCTRIEKTFEYTIIYELGTIELILKIN